MEIKIRIIKGNILYKAQMLLDDKWYYIQNSATLTKYGCQHKIFKILDNQRILDDQINKETQLNVVCEYTMNPSIKEVEN